MQSFGQKEELVERINRLLEGYPRDSTLFKEMLQNADDAGATEVTFM
jgi:sacsin